MDYAKSIAKMRGPHAAIFTPFDSTGEVNLDMLGEIANYQLEQGLHGFFVAGSTGEGLLLSESERNSVLQQIVETTGERGNVIAHVGHPSTDVAIRLAIAAADAGADWIASVAPIYHGTSFEGAMRHYSRIAAATDLPFMVYALNAEIIPERDAAFFSIPNVCGLKYTGANFYSVQQMMRFVDRPVALMSGFDEQFVAGQTFGFHGGIGSTYNFGPQFYANMYRLFREGKIDDAIQLQEDINQITYLMAKYENWSYRKAIMKYIGFDCGFCRSPYAPLTESEFDDYATRLDEIGVLKRNIS
jgi:N-acetylneuraminate lyase